MSVLKAGRKFWMFTLVAAVALLVASPGRASNIAPGGSGPPDSLVQGGFTFLTSTGILNWTATGGRANGTAVSEVNSDPANVFCAGCLDFLYAVGNDSTSLDSMQRVTASLFAGFLTDVGVTPSRGCFGSQGIFPGNAPISVDRSIDGNTVGWNWAIGAGIDPGYCGPVLIIETNARAYTAGTLSIIDSGVATVPSFAPAVPEPGSMMLLGTGLLGLAGIVRRKLRV